MAAGFSALGVPRAVADPPERDQRTAPPATIDIHTHIFPARLFEAVRRWFDRHAWDIRYRFDAEQVDAFWAARGVERYLGLHYAHKAGIAESLNQFALGFCAAHPRCIPCATVYPGEPDAEGILDRALSAGARAVKLHSHVQCVAPDDPRLEPLYGVIERHDALLMFHCGSAPHLHGYDCDLDAVCTAAAFDRAMRRHPGMKVCVPHLAANETDAYVALLPRYPNLYLDTSMMTAGYFRDSRGADFIAEHWPRIVYGTDFPNLPYAWDRDLQTILDAPLTPEQRAQVLGGHARALLGLR